MDEVFTLTRFNHTSHTEDFVYSSQNIYDIIDRMFSVGCADVGYAEIGDFQIYVTDYGRNSIPYKEWRLNDR